MKKAMLYALIFVTGMVLVSLWSLSLALRPPKIIGNQTPSDFGMDWQEVQISTQDGLQLSAWFIPLLSEASALKPDNGEEFLEKQTGPSGRRVTGFIPTNNDADKRALILIHGYPAEKSDLLSIAKSLHDKFSLLLLDLRYFGKSEGKYSTLGLKEQLDLKTSLDLLESKGYKNLGVFGLSLGGAVAILTASRDSRIKAIASYGAFSDLKTLGEETYSRLWILKKPLVRLMVIWYRVLLGEWTNQISPVRAAANLNIPIFLIHSKKDEQISFTHAQALQYALRGNPKAEFYFLEEGLHGELPLDFDSRLKEFFEKSLGNKP